MNDLNCLKESIEELSKFHQVEILKILKSDETITINENKNGIFINMTSLKDSVITELGNYLKYVNKQEKQLNDIEVQKDELSNTYFKDNKDNSSIQLNA
mgnify:FL=1|jgi:hypothetical protein|tara:strand:- start:6341 stop:6637 length:297 start_codon:yes stop_codon:yes gene_type:complete